MIAEKWLGDPEFQGWIAWHQISPARAPVTLITAADAKSLWHIRHVIVEGVIWWSGIALELLPTVRQTLMADELSRIGDQMGRIIPAPPRLAEALTLACRSRQPFTNVTQLARRTGLSRRTLHADWRAVAKNDCELSTFLRWILVVRGVERLARGRALPATAREIGLHQDTLVKSLRLIGGVTVREARRTGGIERVLSGFRSWIVAALGIGMRSVMIGSPDCG